MQLSEAQIYDLRAHERVERNFQIEILRHPIYKDIHCQGVDISQGGLRFKASDITLFKNFTFAATIKANGKEYKINSVQVRSVEFQKGESFYGCKILVIDDEMKAIHEELIHSYENKEQVNKIAFIKNETNSNDETPVNKIPENKETNLVPLDLSRQTEKASTDNDLLEKIEGLEEQLIKLTLQIANNNTLLSSWIENPDITKEELVNEIQLLVTQNRHLK